MTNLNNFFSDLNEALNEYFTIFSYAINIVGRVIVKVIGLTTTGTVFSLSKTGEVIVGFIKGKIQFFTNLKRNTLNFLCEHPKEVCMVIVSGGMLFLYWKSGWDYKLLFPLVPKQD